MKNHAFDRKALQIVEESRRDVDRVMKKVIEAGERSLVGGGSSNLHLQKSETEDGSISKIFKGGDKLLGPLGIGLTAKENYEKAHGDNQKFIVGTVVDTAYSSAATTIGTVIGTALCPPIGAVIGAGAGFLVSKGVNKKWGHPPKSVVDRTKEIANKGVDHLQNIGNGLVSLFR